MDETYSDKLVVVILSVSEESQATGHEILRLRSE